MAPRSQCVAEEPAMRQVKAECATLEEEINELNKEQAVLRNHTSDLKEQCNILRDEVSSKQYAILDAQQETERLSSLIVNSPARVKRVRYLPFAFMYLNKCIGNSINQQKFGNGKGRSESIGTKRAIDDGILRELSSSREGWGLCT